MVNDVVTNVSGDHLHPPNNAKNSAQIVMTKIKKRAMEETTSIPKIYAQELAAASGLEGIEHSERAINLPQFNAVKSYFSLY